MSKTITTRISNKTDTEQNWNSVDLTALNGELIVYSTDASHSSPRIKIGDGTTPVKDLPFIGATGDEATTSEAGLMSASDKSKLDGIEAGANKYTLPAASSSTLGGVKTTSTVTSTSGLTACPIISGVPYYKDTNTTYSEATTSAAGLMSASDKSKLNNIPAGATANTGTITGVQANGTTVATSGTANIPAASTSVYGVTKLSDSITSSSTSLAATPSAVKLAYDLAATANSAAATAQSTANGKAPAYQYSTTDLTAGSSSLTTGTLYFVYE